MNKSRLPVLSDAPRPACDAAGEAEEPVSNCTTQSVPSFGHALRFWLILGCISFGGPAGQIAIMHTELVGKRRWIDEHAFQRGLNFCMLLPGPEAMQLATWLGWRLHGLRGGIAAGMLFVLPAALLMLALSWAYLRHQSLPWMQGVVFGLQAAVLGIVFHAAQRIGGRVLKTPLAMGLALAALMGMAFGVPFPLLLLAAAAAGWWAWRHRPAWLPAATQPAPDGHMQPSRAQAWRAPRVAGACLLLWWGPILLLGSWVGRDSTSFAMAAFFSKTALLTLGGAYAVLPYVADRAVEGYGWLTPVQMMTGLGLAETTPGPLILVLEFVGFAGAWQHPDLGSPLTSALLRRIAQGHSELFMDGRGYPLPRLCVGNGLANAVAEESKPVDWLIAKDKAHVTVGYISAPSTHGGRRHLVLQQMVGDINAVKPEGGNVKQE